MESREMTYGEKAVGLQFNPSGRADVHKIKELYAEIIDQMDHIRSSSESGEVKRLCSIAITEAQEAQMWAVKALTFKG